MLHGDKDRSVTIIDDRAAGLGLVRHSQELHNTAAVRALDRHPEQAVGFGDLPGCAIGRDPQISD